MGKGAKNGKKIEHVDMKTIYTDPQARFAYLAKFADFGEEDIKAIHDAAPAVAPLVQAIVDAVYEKLFHFDCTKEIFLKRNTGFEGVLAEDVNHLSLEDEQIKFRKDFLGKYLVKLVTAKYDHNFIKYLDYVGKVHVNYDPKSKKPHIDYVHCSALFGYVTSFVVDALMSAGLPHDVEKRTVLAFNKLLWIQNDFFAKWYVRDTDKYLPAPAAPVSQQSVVPGNNWVLPSIALAVGLVVGLCFK